MNWPAYPAYKDSGVVWLGRVPLGWKTVPMWTLFKRTKRQGFPDLELLSVYRDYGVLPKASRDDNFNKPSDDLNTYQRVDPGSLVVNKMKAWQGSVSVSEYTGIVSPAYFVYAPRTDQNLRFLHYTLRSGLMTGKYAAISSGVRPNQWDLDPQQFSRLPVLLPPTPEQERIATFLDCETSKIDAVIAKQEQLIVTLREDRTATITQAVTNGLDPAVDMVQPHNFELPACPKHWTVQVSLKRLAEVQTGLTLGKSVDPAEAVDVPYLRVANVQTSGVNLDEVKTVAVHQSELSRYLLRDGDVLMTEGGDIDKLGRGCVWSGEISPCIHQNHVFAVRCTDALASDFLVYLLDTAVARNYFFMTAKKTTNLASTNSTTLGAFTFSLPPRAEQDEIVGHLNKRCAGLDALVAKANAVIKVLREYRAALITDAVTGKIDVRGAVV